MSTDTKQIIADIRTATQKNMKERGQPIAVECARTSSGSAVRSVYESAPHILWMCDQVDKFIAKTARMALYPETHLLREHLLREINRWIGIMQGVMWMTGLTTLDELVVRPAEET